MRVQLHPNAEEELYRAAAAYEERRSDLGFALLAEVDRWLDVLQETPVTWPLWPDAPRTNPPIRRVLLRRFPFAIAYQVHDDRIVLLAIAHTSRRPFYWAERASKP